MNISLFISFIFFPQAVKKQIWSSQSLKNDRYAPCLSSLVLDTSERTTPTNSCKGNQFTYHFVHRDWTSLGTHQHDGDALNSSIFPVKNFESTLRNGDYVVLLFPALFVLCSPQCSILVFLVFYIIHMKQELFIHLYNIICLNPTDQWCETEQLCYASLVNCMILIPDPMDYINLMA